MKQPLVTLFLALSQTPIHTLLFCFPCSPLGETVLRLHEAHAVSHLHPRASVGEPRWFQDEAKTVLKIIRSLLSLQLWLNWASPSALLQGMHEMHPDESTRFRGFRNGGNKGWVFFTFFLGSFWHQCAVKQGLYKTSSGNRWGYVTEWRDRGRQEDLGRKADHELRVQVITTWPAFCRESMKQKWVSVIWSKRWPNQSVTWARQFFVEAL